jgi:PKD repeat protein
MSNIVSNDNIKPIVITQNISRTLSNGAVNITVNDINNGSYDNWDIDSMYLSKTSFNCTDIGANTVNLIAIDKAGNIDSAAATVTIIGISPASPVIMVSRTDNTFTGLPANTIALGYGAQSLILTASNNISDGETMSYSWSPADGLSSTTTNSTQFTPVAAGTYTFTVIATNEFGCSNSESVTLNVIDVRCGNNKVLVTKKEDKNPHSSNQLCISENAVNAHLQNGGALGNSANGNIATTGNNNVSAEETAVLTAFPNPFTSQTTVSFTLAQAEKQVILEIYDLSGYRLLRVYKLDAEANRKYNIQVDASNFQGKLFSARLITRGNVYNFRLIKE